MTSVPPTAAPPSPAEPAAGPASRAGGAGLLLALGDLLIFAAAFPAGHFAANLLRRWLMPSAWKDALVEYPVFRLGVLLFLGAGLLLWFGLARRHYSRRRPFWQELRETLGPLMFAGLLDAALMYAGKEYFSRLAWAASWGFLLAALPVGRVAVKRALHALGRWGKPTLIFGAGENAVEACRALESDWQLGHQVRGFVQVEEPRAGKPVSALPYPRHDKMEDALALARADPGRWHFVLALEMDDLAAQQGLIRVLSREDADLTVVPPLRGLPLHGLEATHFFSHEVLLLHLRNNLAQAGPIVVKRLFDVVFSFLGLLALSPVLLVIAVLVRRDGGPATFGHRRVGQGGKPFRCLKFRSMVVDAESRLHALLSSDPAARAEWSAGQKLKDDPRVTRLGRFLRKSSLDEFPQLLNVLKGEMSLVGPRPIVEEEVARYGDDAPFYFEAKPGVTGLWQVSGRNDADYTQRVMLDTWYVQNWSLWYDIVILVKTLRILINRQGAY